EGIDGDVPMYFDLAPRFGYGLYQPWIRPDDGGFELIAGPHALRLEGKVKFEAKIGHLRAGFDVRPGQRLAFTLEPPPSHEPAQRGLDAEALLRETDSWWREWTGRCTYQGRWRDHVVRSLITLKALTYEPTGAIVAAGTASLPEDLGGVRNWD